MSRTNRMILSLFYLVAGVGILAWHTPWWVWVSVILILDPIVIMLKYLSTP